MHRHPALFPASRIARLLAVFALFSASAFAQLLRVTMSGTYTGNSPTNTFTIPGASWSLSFQVNTKPSVFTTSDEEFRTLYTNGVFMLNGASIPVTGNTVIFATHSINVFLDSNTQFIATVPQTFSGDPNTSPTILPGSYPTSNVTSYTTNPVAGFFDGFTTGDSNVVITALPLSILAHVADGNGFDTLALLINTGTSDAGYLLQFFNQAGVPVTYPVDSAQSGMSGVIHAGSQAIVRTTGSGTVTNAGWGQLSAPASVKGMLIYQQQASPSSLQEGSAPIIPTSQHLFFPFDNVNGATTSIGFVNPSATQIANVNFTVRYESGGTDVVPAFAMNPMQQMAQTVTFFWGSTAGKRGMIEVTADAPIGLVAFRFQGAAFTLFDTIAPSGGGPSPVTSTIAHTADGNNFRSTFLLTNSGTSDTSYTLNILNATGQPQTFGFDTANPLSGTIRAGSTLTLNTTGQGTSTNLGWAQLSAAPAVSGIEVFRQTNPGQTEQQGTVPITQTNLSHAFLPFDNVANTTSIALANPDPGVAAIVNVTFRSVDGTSNTGQITLQPRNYIANLLSGIFSVTTGKAGVAEFTSNVPIAVVEVRFNPTQAFTSLRAVGP